MIDASEKKELINLRNSNSTIKNLRGTKLTYKNCKRLMEQFANDPLFVLAYEEIGVHFKQNEKKIVKWFFAENPLVGNIRPIEMIILGRQKTLVEFIFGVKK